MCTSHYTKRFISPWSDEQPWHLWGRVAFYCMAIGQQHCRVYGDIVHCLHTPGQCPALCGLKDIPAYLCGHWNSANEISVSGMGLGWCYWMLSHCGILISANMQTHTHPTTCDDNAHTMVLCLLATGRFDDFCLDSITLTCVHLTDLSLSVL